MRGKGSGSEGSEERRVKGKVNSRIARWHENFR